MCNCNDKNKDKLQELADTLEGAVKTLRGIGSPPEKEKVLTFEDLALDEKFGIVGVESDTKRIKVRADSYVYIYSSGTTGITTANSSLPVFRT